MHVSRIRTCIQRSPVSSLSHVCGIAADTSEGSLSKSLVGVSSSLLVPEAAGHAQQPRHGPIQQVRSFAEPAYSYAEPDTIGRAFAEPFAANRCASDVALRLESLAASSELGAAVQQYPRFSSYVT